MKSPSFFIGKGISILRQQQQKQFNVRKKSCLLSLSMKKKKKKSTRKREEEMKIFFLRFLKSPCGLCVCGTRLHATTRLNWIISMTAAEIFFVWKSIEAISATLESLENWIARRRLFFAANCNSFVTPLMSLMSSSSWSHVYEDFHITVKNHWLNLRFLNFLSVRNKSKSVWPLKQLNFISFFSFSNGSTFYANHMSQRPENWVCAKPL